MPRRNKIAPPTKPPVNVAKSPKDFPIAAYSVLLNPTSNINGVVMALAIVSPILYSRMNARIIQGSSRRK